jgi:hypothetical protein
MMMLLDCCDDLVPCDALLYTVVIELTISDQQQSPSSSFVNENGQSQKRKHDSTEVRWESPHLHFAISIPLDYFRWTTVLRVRVLVVLSSLM